MFGKRNLKNITQLLKGESPLVTSAVLIKSSFDQIEKQGSSKSNIQH